MSNDRYLATRMRMKANKRNGYTKHGASTRNGFVLVVSQNGGTPKWCVYHGKNIPSTKHGWLKGTHPFFSDFSGLRKMNIIEGYYPLGVKYIDGYYPLNIIPNILNFSVIIFCRWLLSLGGIPIIQNHWRVYPWSPLGVLHVFFFLGQLNSPHKVVLPSSFFQLVYKP